MTRRFSRQDQLAAMRSHKGRAPDDQSSEPHRVSAPRTRFRRVRTNDRITHVALPDYVSQDDNDVVTLCGLRLHHCNLGECRHPGRHRARTFSVRRPDDEMIDCMTCLTYQARQEGA